MNRSGVAAIVICAAVAGLGGGYMLGHQAAAPASEAPALEAPALEAPASQSAPRDPGAPNGIAALATAKSGGPVTPFSGRASPIQSSLASFSIACPGCTEPVASRTADPRKAASGVEACLNGALGRAVSSIGTPGATEATPCGSGGTAKLEGRFRLAIRPAVSLVGKPSPGAVGCEATLRWGIESGAPAQELHASAYGDTSAAACEASGKDVVAQLLQKL